MSLRIRIQNELSQNLLDSCLGTVLSHASLNSTTQEAIKIIGNCTAQQNNHKKKKHNSNRQIRDLSATTSSKISHAKLKNLQLLF